MIYIAFSLFYLLKERKIYSISNFLFILLLFSSIAAYLVGRQPSLDFNVTIYVIYNAILLYILFSSFKSYRNLEVFNEKNVILERLQTVEKTITIFGLIVLIINIYIFYNVFNMLISGSLEVQQHKNEGGAAAVFSQFVPSYLISFSNLFSPLGYLSQALHFYYLIKGRILKSLLHLLLSLLISLSGLLALSRSSTTVFLLVYISMFLFIFPLLNKKIRNKIIIISGSVLIIVTLIITTISSSRFSERYSKNSLNKSYINNEENPQLFSFLDYFSQWEENGPIILEKHKPWNNYWGIFNSSGLIVHFQKIIYGGNKINNLRDNEFYNLLGDQMSKFHGNISRLVYDFGFGGTILFILIYSYLVKKLRPVNGIINFKTILFLPVLLPFCVQFFSGNAFGSLSLNIAIVYALFVNFYIKKSKRIS